MNFPTSLDDFTNPTTANKLNSPSHSQQHADNNDAIEALEAKVGINSSGVTTSHDYKLGDVTGSFKAVKSDFWVSVSATLTFSSTDSPVYVVGTSADLTASIGVGMKMKFTNNSTTFYGIVVAITASTITLYGGTDYSVANSAITNVFYSSAKSPIGFPMSPAKWKVRVTDVTERSQATPVSDTWYNVGGNSITIPIGVWDVRWQGNVYCSSSTVQAIRIRGTLSTGNNSETDTELTGTFNGYVNSTATSSTMNRAKILTLAAKTQYFFNSSVSFGTNSGTLFNENNVATLILEATCAFL